MNVEYQRDPLIRIAKHQNELGVVYPVGVFRAVVDKQRGYPVVSMMSDYALATPRSAIVTEYDEFCIGRSFSVHFTRDNRRQNLEQAAAATYRYSVKASTSSLTFCLGRSSDEIDMQVLSMIDFDQLQHFAIHTALSTVVLFTLARHTFLKGITSRELFPKEIVSELCDNKQLLRLSSNYRSMK